MKLKKAISALLAAAMTMGVLSMSAIAATVSDPTGEIGFIDSGYRVYDEDKENVSSSFSVADGSVTADEIYFGKTYYFELASETNSISWQDLTDASNFTFKLQRDQNGTYLESVKLTTRDIRGVRRAYIAVQLKSSNLTEEKKVSFDVYFKARKDGGSLWSNGDLYNARFNLWVTNRTEQGSDANVNTGQGVVFEPVSNEQNVITWGANEDVASLEFTASSDAQKFYAKLSTKVNSSIYAEYGDPVDADLYFRSFSGSSVDSTSRAKLTLYNPWYDDDDVNPKHAYIYRIDGDTLVDITDQFTYVTEDDTPSYLDGWQIKVRTLGSYVISDRELDVYGNYEDDDYETDRDVVVEKPVKPEAPAATGSQDFTALALTLAVVSAGALVALRKRK